MAKQQKAKPYPVISEHHRDHRYHLNSLYWKVGDSTCLNIHYPYPKIATASSTLLSSTVIAEIALAIFTASSRDF